MRRTSFVVMSVCSLLIAAYAFGMYSVGPGAVHLHPDMRASFARHPVGIGTHISAASLALLLGPFQFSSRLRSRWPAVHRWTGRVYLGVAVLVGGLAGLYISQFAYGGVMSELGFAGLALAWLFTGLRAYLSARARDFPAHRHWMILNYSLSLAAVTLRLYLLPVFIFHIPFELAYPVISWLCWVPNLLMAQFALARRRNFDLKWSYLRRPA